MIESVDFWARRQAEGFSFQGRHAVISIGDPGQALPDLSCPGDVLRVEFFDLIQSFDTDARFGPESLFTAEKARQVWEFIRKLNESPEKWELIVHCEAGVKRSAAIALCAEAITGCAFPSRAKANFANRLVLSVFNDTFGLSLTAPEPLSAIH